MGSQSQLACVVCGCIIAPVEFTPVWCIILWNGCSRRINSLWVSILTTELCEMLDGGFDCYLCTWECLQEICCGFQAVIFASLPEMYKCNAVYLLPSLGSSWRFYMLHPHLLSPMGRKCTQLFLLSYNYLSLQKKMILAWLKVPCAFLPQSHMVPLFTKL